MTNNYWKIRLEDCRQALEKNNFKAYIADDCSQAKYIVFDKIIPDMTVRRIAWGDSMTMHATGVLEALKAYPGADLIETFAEDVPRQTLIERRRQALLADLFVTGSNAVTDSGKLVNLDMVGNRVAAIAFGPRHVIVFVGRNKLVTNVESAMQRVKRLAAPMNVIRHHTFKTPCRKTGRCEDCKSPNRICNTWIITEKSYPRGRIAVVLINADLGL